MRVKLFSQDPRTAVQFLENEINSFLESNPAAHVRHVSMTASDIERIASVWYDELEPRSIAQLSTVELKEMVEDA